MLENAWKMQTYVKKKKKKASISYGSAWCRTAKAASGFRGGIEGEIK